MTRSMPSPAATATTEMPSPAAAARVASRTAPALAWTALSGSTGVTDGRAVASKGTGSGLADVTRLIVEVLDADAGEVAEREAIGDDRVGALVVDMDLDGAGVAGDEDRFAELLQPGPDAIDVEPGLSRREQVHRLVPEALIGSSDEARATWRAAGRRRGLEDRLVADHVAERALEEPIEALAAGIDDAGLAQDGEHRWRPGDGPFRLLDRRGQHALHVGVALGARHGGHRRLPDDGQDGALDRLGDRGIGGLAAGRKGVREIEAVDPPTALDRLRHAPEDLAQDDPRVAARAHQGAEGDGRRDASGVTLGWRQALGLFEGGAERGDHVRAGVTVGDGEDVEGVDLVDVGPEVDHGRRERAQQRRAIRGPTAHAAPGRTSRSGGG